MLVSVDPGLHVCGVALWSDGELSEAWLAVAPTDPPPLGYLPWEWMAKAVARDLADRTPRLGADLAIEVPQVYHQSKLKGDPNDLIDIALVAGAVATRVAAYHGGVTTTYRPQAWKGSTPKKVMVERIKAKLSAEEHLRVVPPRAAALAHNVWDAVGIGLHHLQRQRRR